MLSVPRSTAYFKAQAKDGDDNELADFGGREGKTLSAHSDAMNSNFGTGQQPYTEDEDDDNTFGENSSSCEEVTAVGGQWK